MEVCRDLIVALVDHGAGTGAPGPPPPHAPKRRPAGGARRDRSVAAEADAHVRTAGASGWLPDPSSVWSHADGHGPQHRHRSDRGWYAVSRCRVNERWPIPKPEVPALDRMDGPKTHVTKRRP